MTSAVSSRRNRVGCAASQVRRRDFRDVRSVIVPQPAALFSKIRISTGVAFPSQARYSAPFVGAAAALRPCVRTSVTAAVARTTIAAAHGTAGRQRPQMLAPAKARVVLEMDAHDLLGMTSAKVVRPPVRRVDDWLMAIVQ